MMQCSKSFTTKSKGRINQRKCELSEHSHIHHTATTIPEERPYLYLVQHNLTFIYTFNKFLTSFDPSVLMDHY